MMEFSFVNPPPLSWSPSFIKGGQRIPTLLTIHYKLYTEKDIWKRVFFLIEKVIGYWGIYTNIPFSNVNFSFAMVWSYRFIVFYSLISYNMLLRQRLRLPILWYIIFLGLCALLIASIVFQIRNVELCLLLLSLSFLRHHRREVL